LGVAGGDVWEPEQGAINVDRILFASQSAENDLSCSVQIFLKKYAKVTHV